MKLKKEFGLEYEASVKKVEGNDWYPVVAFEFNKSASRTREFLREKCGDGTADQFLVNGAVFVSFEDGVDTEDGDEIVTVTFGVETEPAAATFYGYRQVRVYNPLFRLRPSDSAEDVCYKIWKDMCERRGFRPDNHTAMVFGQMAIAFSDGRLSVSDKWEEGLW